MNDERTITLPDGRVFPCYKGETLSWPVGSTFTLQDAQEGYPRTKLVLSLTSTEQLLKEQREELKASFNPVFGRQAKKMLALIEAELTTRPATKEKDL